MWKKEGTLNTVKDMMDIFSKGMLFVNVCTCRVKQGHNCCDLLLMHCCWYDLRV